MRSKKLYLETVTDLVSSEPTKEVEVEGKNEREKKRFELRQWVILIVLIYANTCHGFCYSLQAPFFPLEAEQKGLTATQYGFVFSVYELSMFIFANVMGRLIFIVKPRIIMLCGQTILAVTVISFGLLDKVDNTHLFLGLAISIRIVEGIASAMIKISANSIGPATFPDNTTTVYSTLQSFIGMGIIVGPIVGGSLYDAFGYSVPFFTAGGVCVLALISSIAVLPSSKTEHGGTKTAKVPPSNGKKFLTSPGVLIYGLGVFTMANFVGFNAATLEPHLRPAGYSGTNIGTLSAVVCVTFLVFSPLVGWICDRGVDTKLLCMFSCLVILTSQMLIGPMPFLPLESTWAVTIPAMACLGLAYVCQVGPSFRGMLTIAESKGFTKDTTTYGYISSFTTSAHALGACIGPVFGGFILDNISYDAGITILFGVEMLRLMLMIVYTAMVASNAATSTEGNIKSISIKTIA